MESPDLPAPPPRRRAFGRPGTTCLAVLLALAGIQAGSPLEAAPALSTDRWEGLRAQDLRVASVSYRLAVANQALCRGALAPQLGFVIHALDQYGPADRAQAARSFGLGDHVGVMAVVAGSPAEKAGLEADDALLAMNGRALAEGLATSGPPGRAMVEQARQILLEELGKGGATLRILRAGVARDLRFAADTGCRSNVELAPGGGVNAWADGERVVIGDGILARCASDDDLALVIGHELAHNLLRHGQEPGAGASRDRLLLLPGSGSTAMRVSEEEADLLAVRLARAADYDLRGAEAFLGGLLRETDAAAATHPEPRRRLALLRAAIAAEGGF